MKQATAPTAPPYRTPPGRRRFQELLGARVAWTPLKPDTKLPAVPLGKVRYQAAPDNSSQGWGVKPQGRLIIFDLDTKQGVSMNHQLSTLSKAFSLHLRDTLTVQTPSGGLHLYALWPEDLPLPGNIPLRRLRELGIELDGDLRCGGVNSYCVAPGTRILEGLYSLAPEHQRLKPIRRKAAQALLSAFEVVTGPRRTSHWAAETEAAEDEAALQARLREVRKTAVPSSGMVRVKRAAKSSTPKPAPLPPPALEALSPAATVSEEPAGPEAAPGKPRVEAAGEQLPRLRGKQVEGARLEPLRKLLAAHQGEPYHRRRAVLYGAIGCCASPELFSAYCRALKLNWDSYRKRTLRDSELLADARRLQERRGKNLRHHKYCLRGLHRQTDKQRAAQEPLDPSLTTAEVLTVRAAKRLQSHSTYRRPQVLHMIRVVQALTQGRRSRGQELALRIAEDFLQPWCNLGVTRIVLANDFLSKVYRVEAAEVRAAKRLLQTRGILVLATRQAPGVSSSFKVAPAYISGKLTRQLVRVVMAQEGRVEVVFDHRDGVFINHLSGEVLLELAGGSTQGQLPAELLACLPEERSPVTLIELLREPALTEELLTRPKRKVAATVAELVQAHEEAPQDAVAAQLTEVFTRDPEPFGLELSTPQATAREVATVAGALSKAFACGAGALEERQPWRLASAYCELWTRDGTPVQALTWCLDAKGLVPAARQEVLGGMAREWLYATVQEEMLLPQAKRLRATFGEDVASLGADHRAVVVAQERASWVKQLLEEVLWAASWEAQARHLTVGVFERKLCSPEGSLTVVLLPQDDDPETWELLGTDAAFQQALTVGHHWLERLPETAKPREPRALREAILADQRRPLTGDAFVPPRPAPAAKLQGRPKTPVALLTAVPMTFAEESLDPESLRLRADLLRYWKAMDRADRVQAAFRCGDPTHASCLLAPEHRQVVARYYGR